LFSNSSNALFSLPANDCQAGVVYVVTAGGTMSAATAGDMAQFYIVQGPTLTQLTGTSGLSYNSLGAGSWTLTAQITCQSTTTVAITGSVTMSADGVNQSAGTAKEVTGNFTAKNGATWVATVDALGLSGNWVSGNDTSGDTMTANVFSVQRLGP
jgi:hypothetical protein